MNKIISLIIIAFVISFWGCEKKSTEVHDEHGEEHNENENHTEIVLSLDAQKTSGVEVSTAEISKLSGYLTIPAKVISNQDNEALVGSLIKGRVKKIYAAPGKYISENSPLLMIEGLEISNIKSDYKKAKTNLGIAESVFQRQKQLIEQNAGSQKSLLEAKAELERAKAEFEYAHQKIHSLGINDNEIESNSSDHSAGTLIIRAPISGYISERNVVTGQLIDETSNAFKIINTATVWIEGDLPETQQQAVTTLKTVHFNLTTLPGEQFNGKLIFISPVLDTHTKTIKIRSEVNNRNGLLKPEAFGTLKIPISSEVNSILIPLESIVKEKEKTFVFVAENDSTFIKKEVLTGMEINGMVEITNGLEQGTPYVKKGVLTLKSELIKESFGHDH